MADEALRMQAEVVDKFSGPLKSLRAQLLDTSRQGAAHGEALAKGLNKAEAAAQATANTAKTVLNPALAGIGITGLGAGVAVAGIASALNSLSGNLSSLGQLGRETGMAADQLRIFQSVAGKFGVSGDAASAAAKSFSTNMRDIRRGVGETMGFLQSQNQVVAQFGIKLKGTKNNDEALKMTEEFLEQIPNAVDRGRFAEKLFGNMDLGRLGDKHLGAIKDLNAKAGEKLGPLDPKAVESAERYERALGDLRSSMTRIGTTIAMELLPPAERFTTWLDDIASGKRKALIDGLRQGMHDIGAELGAIDWKAAGQSAEQMLTSTTMLVKPLAEGVKEIAAAIKSFNEGKPAEALRHLDGGSGPLARRLAPMKGDDEIDAAENVEKLRKLRDVSKDAAGHLIGRTQQRMGLLDSPEAAQQKLDAAEAELKRLQGRTPEQRQKDYDQSTERLRKSVDGLSEQLKSQQGATAQKSSLDGDEMFGGARIQAASLGGARIYGGPGGYGAFSGGNRDAAREAFRQYLMRRVPGYDGGATVPTGPDGTIPGLGYRPGAGGRVSGMGGGASRLPGLDSGGGTSVTRGSFSANQQEAYRAARAEGLSDAAAHALVANMSGESLRNPRDHHWDRKHMSQGIVQWDPQRAEAIRRKFGAYPKDMSVTDQTRAAIDEIRSNPRFRRTARALEGNDPNAMLGALVENYEAPQDTRRALADRQRFYRGFRPDGAVAESDRPRIARMEGGFTRRAEVLADSNDERWKPDGSFGSEADDSRASRDLGIAFRSIARKRREMEANSARLDAAAGRAGVVGGPHIENNGSVNVTVQRPGPDTSVRTSASGNLFKDVVLQRGRTMASAGGT